MRPRAHIAWISLILAVCALAVLSAGTVSWFLRIPFSGEERRLNLFLLGFFVSLIAGRLRRLPKLPSHVLQWPQNPLSTMHRIALALFVTAIGLHTALRHSFGENTLTAVLLLLALYAGIALFLRPPSVRAGLPGLLLLVAALPFAALAEGYVGLWARIYTAEVVQQLLSLLHVPVLPVSNILLLERGLAHVDIACSGLRGLWSGALAYLLVTFLDRRSIGGAWLLGLLLLELGLLLANIGRVFVLVCLAHVAEAPQLAEALHVPLGLFGFVLCVAFGFFYLRGRVPAHAPRHATNGSFDQAAPATDPLPANTPHAHRTVAVWLPPSVATLLIALCIFDRGTARSPQSPRIGLHDLSSIVPAALRGQPVDLNQGEREIFDRFGAHAQKWRIPGGSLIAVQSPTLTAFRAHHPPEVCLLGAGLRVVTAQNVWIGPQAQARLLTLNARQAVASADSAPQTHAALYWFQSANRSTPDILSRIAAQIWRPQPWVLVTLIHDAVPASTAASRSASTQGSTTTPTSAQPATESADRQALIDQARDIHHNLAQILAAAPAIGAQK